MSPGMRELILELGRQIDDKGELHLDKERVILLLDWMNTVAKYEEGMQEMFKKLQEVLDEN
jgi:hypothetical protein